MSAQLLAGYYGFDNLGDELLCQSVIGLLQEVQPDKKIIIATAKSEGSRKEVDVVNRWSIPALWRALGRCDRLILGGGGLFQDSTSLRSVLYYWGLLRLARLRGCKTAALGQSVGPLRRRTARWFAKNALTKSTVTVRDQSSLMLCESLGVTATMQDDFVLALQAPPLNHQKGLLVNLRPWKDGLAEQVARSAQSYATGSNLSIHGLAFAPEDLSLMRNLQEKGIITFDTLQLLSPANPFLPFAQGNEGIGMRLHFGVLSLLLGLKAAIAPYDPKVQGFLSRWGGKVWSKEDPRPQEFINRTEIPLVRAAIVKQLQQL